MGFEFLSLGWLAAAPAFLGALFLLYFLKLKRREVTVSSTFLWQRALDDMRVNSPFQRLRMNLLLLLQALALLLLLLALARPVSNLGGLKGTDAVLLIDVSASMLATDGGGGTSSRFERAKAEARRVIDDLSFGDRAMLLAFADDVRVLSPLTESKSVLRAALDDLQPTHRPTHLAAAVARVRAVLQDAERHPEVHIFSDGRVGDLEGVALEADVPLRFVRTGEATANLGIAGIDVRMPSGLGEGTRVLVSVQNTGEEAARVGIDLSLAGDEPRLLDSREEEVPAGGIVSVSFEHRALEELLAGGDTRRLEVRLDPPDGPDAFPLDDLAYALLRPQEPVRTLLVSEGNLFLASALAEDPLVWKTPRGGVPGMAPAAFDPADPALREYDLIVLDRWMPEALPPGSYLTFAAAPPFEGFTDQGAAEDVSVLDWDESHEVARFVNFATLVLPTARRFTVRDADTVVVRGDEGPLVVEAREGDRLVVACAFDLMSFPVEGAWTFDPSYPIFLANAVRWLGGHGHARKSMLLATGDTAELRFPAGARRARVAPPEGPARTLEIREGDDLLRVTELDRVGFYEVTFEDDADGALETLTFAVNLASPEEGSIAPSETLELEGVEVQASEEAIEANRDMWKLAAVAALLFVLVEWWVYNRRVFI